MYLPSGEMDTLLSGIPLAMTDVRIEGTSVR